VSVVTWTSSVPSLFGKKLINMPTPLRPHTPQYPLIVIIADGWSRNVFLDSLDRGLLPEIEQGLVDPGVLIPTVVSNLPSVSFASHTTLLTGSPPQQHLIPGHRWADSIEVRNYVGRQFRRVNSDMSKSVSTLFENHPRASGIAIQSVIRRGANASKTFLRLNSEAILRRATRTALRNPKSVIVVWLPNGDAAAHRGGPTSAGVVADMMAASRGVGHLTRELERAGLLESSRLVLVSDHGHRHVVRRAFLVRILQGLGIKAIQNPKHRPKRHMQSMPTLVLTSGDSAAYLYPPTEISQLSLADKIAKREEVEMVCWRKDSGTHYVFSSHGLGEIVPISNHMVEYRLLRGSDPLKLLGRRLSASFDLTNVDLQREAAYPDFLYQYLNSFVEGRSGSLLVLAARGWHFSSAPRLGHRLGFHRGSHGGPFPEEMLVAAVARGVGREPEGPVRLSELLSALDVLNDPTVSSDLGRPPVSIGAMCEP
jgi:Type I phosphodiesterase / nucleotide pyrophosphatase